MNSKLLKTRKFICVNQKENAGGVYIRKSIVNYLRHENFICKSEGIYLTYEHRSEIPVEFTYVNQ